MGIYGLEGWVGIVGGNWLQQQESDSVLQWWVLVVAGEQDQKWPFGQQLYHVKLPRNRIKNTINVSSKYGLPVVSLEAISPVFTLRFLGCLQDSA